MLKCSVWKLHLLMSFVIIWFYIPPSNSSANGATIKANGLSTFSPTLESQHDDGNAAATEALSKAELWK